ncbi:MAG: excinuclease ABC subunit UvrC [Bacteroidia bacterium]|nr:excinuclease ABC subunit UvrC [Bacteroidia bacterium]MCC6768848.1 excinuclease ABC subunit UvrC [Bacteroidia bacterium]
MQICQHIEAKLKTLPEKPGIYQYFDEQGKIIYVGKAKNLKKRVGSYFHKNHDDGKTRVMVSRISDIQILVVDTELDALLLENNLIKKYQPRYNVLLKDDKTFPWICIKNERFPRIFPTRKVIQDGSEYFGPYPSVKVMRSLLDFIKMLYPRRTCNLNLQPSFIAAGKFKACLELHLGNCKAPCIGLQSEEDYMENIRQIRHIIKGNIQDLIRMVRTRMMEEAAAYRFEQAQELKERLELLEKYKSKSTIVNPSISEVDVYSIITEEKIACVNYLRVHEGSIIMGHTIELKKRLDETPEALLSIGIGEMRQRFESKASELIVPFMPDFEDTSIQFTIPKIGDKKKLLELSERNALNYLREKNRQAELIDPERHSKRILEQLKKDLRMPVLPVWIECFDNSNFQGAYPVSAMVCFKNAKPSKKDYRHFNVKTVEGPDDFATMREVISRRYTRLIQEEAGLPQLIVIDGGKGQLGAVMEAMEVIGLRGKITVIGIAKRLEEIYFPDDSIPLYIDKKSESLKLIQQLRNEAHRFGITHHRSRRDKGTLKTELNEISGIGAATAEKLLTVFRSVKGVKESSMDDLAKAIGNAKARLVYSYFNETTKNSKEK